MRNAGRYEEALEYSQENHHARLHLAANKADKQIRELRERKRELEQQGASREVVRAIEQQMIDQMEMFNKLASNK